MLISEPATATACVVVLLPPAVVPPLVSLVAPVVAVTVTLPEAVGVPLTGHEMLKPAATVAGGVGEQVPIVTPAGRPDTAQLAAAALAVAAALFVHLMVPEYGVPTVAVAGRPERSGVISEPVVVIELTAVLLAGVPSLVAPVVPVSDAVPTEVGVPETLHKMAAPAATVVGGVGEHDVVRPTGRPAIAHVAPVAARAGDAALVQVNVPVYG